MTWPKGVTTRQLALTIVPLGLAAAIRLLRGGSTAFTNDDAYISQHAAHYLSSATDPSYPGSTPLFGVTSLLHVLALWLAMRACNPSVAVEVVTWLGAVFYLAGVVALVTARLQSIWQQVAAVALALTGGTAVAQLANGQETGWAMAAVIWGLYFLDSDRPERSRIPLLAATLPALRPDLALFGAALCVWRWRHASSRIGRDAAVVGGCWAAYAVFMWWAIGAPFPNTLAAKREFFATYSFPLGIKLLLGCILLAGWVAQVGPLVVPLMAGIRSAPKWPAALAFAMLIVTVSIASPNVISHNDYRYLYPLALPMITAGFCRLTGRWRTTMLFVSLVWVLASAPLRLREWAAAEALYVDGQVEVAKWLNTNAPAGTSVLVHDAGYLSEFTQAQLTDLVGLKTPSSTTWHRLFTGPDVGHGRARAVHEIACRAVPKYYVAFSGWERAFRLTLGLAEYGWGPVAVFSHETQGPEGRLAYTIYRLFPSARCAVNGDHQEPRVLAPGSAATR